MTQMLTPVLPKTIRLVNGPVPFLTFFKSLDERRRLGVLDRQCAVFVLPAGRAAMEVTTNAGEMQDWERHWGDSGDDHKPQEWPSLMELMGTAKGDLRTEKLTKILGGYLSHTQEVPASIRLPFVLQYQEVKKQSNEALDWLDFPRQLFSLELTFSSSEYFVPIDAIRIPFIAEQGRTNGGQEASGFPRMNKLLLKLQPLSPVPTSFGVNIAFNDCLGHMYFGQLETFDVAFQDLFLPVRLPMVFWSDLFELLWKGGMTEPCWSVKVMDLDREVVHGLIRSQLGPFVVPSESEVHLEEEDFDFEQEEYFERWIDSQPVDTGISDETEVVVRMDTVCSIVFIPPCHHLLMRFTISSQSTVVRVLTDRFQLLSYMDAFFLSWSRTAAVGESKVLATNQVCKVSKVQAECEQADEETF
jgi:hypothetical protein